MAETLIDELLEDARERMHKSVEAAQHEFSTVRTGLRPRRRVCWRRSSSTVVNKNRSLQ